MHVAVDLGVAALAHLLDRPGHVRSGQVVQEAPVGDLPGQAQHALVEGADDDLGPVLAEADPEPEPRDLVEVALEVDLLARQARPEQRDELADLGEGAIAVAGPVPAPGDHRGGDADADEDVTLRDQGLEGGRGHGQEGRGAQLQGDDACTEVERRHPGRDRPEEGERFGPDHLGRPERAISQVSGPVGDVDGARGGDGALE